jgi:hypothetical protein
MLWMARRIRAGESGKAIGIVRVSTSKQGIGAAAQRAELERWAAREDVELLAIFEDIGVFLVLCLWRSDLGSSRRLLRCGSSAPASSSRSNVIASPAIGIRSPISNAKCGVRRGEKRGQRLYSHPQASRQLNPARGLTASSEHGGRR